MLSTRDTLAVCTEARVVSHMCTFFISAVFRRMRSAVLGMIIHGYPVRLRFKTRHVLCRYCAINVFPFGCVSNDIRGVNYLSFIVNHDIVLRYEARARTMHSI